MEYFIKATTEENEITNFLLKNPLCFAALFEISRRARRKEEECRILGLKQGEFLISETEYKKFGLKKTQKNKLARAIKSLTDLKIIEKTGNRTGNAQSNIYRLIDLSIFMPHFENGERNGEVAGNGRGTVGERSGTKEECKKEKKEKKEKENICVLTEQEDFLSSIECVVGKKKLTKEAREKLNTRLKSYSMEELKEAFLNLANEPDLWKIKNNGFRPLSWWLKTDDRIEEMRNCHKKMTKNTIGVSPIE